MGRTFALRGVGLVLGGGEIGALTRRAAPVGGIGFGERAGDYNGITDAEQRTKCAEKLCFLNIEHEDLCGELLGLQLDLCCFHSRRFTSLYAFGHEGGQFFAIHNLLPAQSALFLQCEQAHGSCADFPGKSSLGIAHLGSGGGKFSSGD